jgi:hypothetical protein
MAALTLSTTIAGVANNGTGAATANDCVVNLSYK